VIEFHILWREGLMSEPVTIKLLDNGPYEVRGTFTFLDGDGNLVSLAEKRDSDAESIFLCRCGHSASKPFCDGTHRRVGFESQVRV
jgi:CDGSH-type Zn-finger protein